MSSLGAFVHALLPTGLISPCALGHNVGACFDSVHQQRHQICIQFSSLVLLEHLWLTLIIAYRHRYSKILAASLQEAEDPILCPILSVINMSKKNLYPPSHHLSKWDKLDEYILRIRSIV